MGSWVKGQPRPAGSGMQKGQKTVRTQQTSELYAKLCAKYGDPLEALAEMAFDPANDIQIRQNSLKEVVKYGHGQKKLVELSGPDGSPLQLTHRLDLIEQITGAVHKLGTKGKD